MSINSGVFLLFLAAAVTLYYLTPPKGRYLTLLAASTFFYLASSVKASGYLLLTILMTYAAGRGLGLLRERESAADPPSRSGLRRGRRLLLGTALFLNFATLAVFKYWDSWLGGVNGLFRLVDLSFQFRPLSLLLPLGISFYIFQTSGYLIDVYRGRAKPERNLLKYALFTSYFPQMVQGPINRYGKLQPQLLAENRFSPENLKNGIQLMLWGMLKKALIADTLYAAVSEIYNNYTQYSGAVVFLGAALYCLQLYCDFSGGTDLVRGVSRLFGVEMAENFRRPYFARSVDEFWRRWHISLGEWMKDYLFFPLALCVPLNRLGKAVRKRFGPWLGKTAAPCIATVAVFLVVGLWQGPGMANIAYGLWNGGLIALAMLLGPLFAKGRERLGIQAESRWFSAFQVLRTCLLVVIGRYFSRADSLGQALGMLKRTVLHWYAPGMGTLSGLGLSAAEWLLAGAATAVLVLVSVLQERGVDVKARLEEKHWAVQFAVLFLAVLLVYSYLNMGYTGIAYVYENV